MKIITVNGQVPTISGAALEAAEGGAAFYSGTITPVDRTAAVSFACAGATHLVLLSNGEFDLDTGKAFLSALIVSGTNSERAAISSNNAGTIVNSRANVGNYNSSGYTVTFPDSGIKLTPSATLATSKLLQEGHTYNWYAW